MSNFGQIDALRELQAQLARPTTDDGEPVVGRAVAQNKQVTIEVTDARFSAVKLDARALRDLSNEELAEVILTTANEAMDDYLRASSQTGATATFESALAEVDQVASRAEADFHRSVADLQNVLDSVQRLASAQQGEQERRARQSS